MTAEPETRKARPRRAQAVLFAILPLLTMGYQIAAKTSAEQLSGVQLDLDWLLTAARMPSMQILLVLEIASFVAWMTVLAELPLSAAFPLSAVNYLLIILASAVVFHEPLGALQAVGGATILAGVWLIGRGGTFSGGSDAA